LLYS
jgi:hypothetical protein